MAKSSTRLAMATAAALAIGAGSAQAACNATISDITPLLVVFNPFDGMLAFQDFEVRVINGSDAACTLSMAVKSDATGGVRLLTNGAHTLNYVIKSDGGVLLVNDLGSPAGVLNLEGGVGKEGVLRARIEVPAGQVSGAGAYSDFLTLRLYDLATSQALGADKTTTLLGVVPARAQMNLAGGDAAFGNFTLDQLNFGELAEGATRTAAVQVRSTAPVTVTVLSQHGGALRHKVLGPSTPSVPYTLTLAGVAANFASGALSIDRTPPLTLSGASYPLQVTIGSVAGRVAGDYQDILTISVVPR